MKSTLWLGAWIGTFYYIDVNLTPFWTRYFLIMTPVAITIHGVHVCTREYHEDLVAMDVQSINTDNNIPRVNSNSVIHLMAPDNCQTCPICLENIQKNTRCASFACMHILHNDCISRLINSGSVSCPVCRYEP